MIVSLIGGVGLFLIGMTLTTEGLRAAAGNALRRILLRYTGGPFKAMLTGAGVTALIQSSSATTVAAIGFVSAGLLSFPQTVGVIYGANIGSTATSWLVAGLGLKFTMTAVALPMVGVGAFMRLFLRGRWANIGYALAGFGIIFLGLDVLQTGMKEVSGVFTAETLPQPSFIGNLALVGIGFLMTAVMQSSSAAVATVLTALHAGAISLEQAAAVVIGSNVGTTATAWIASIGAGAAARRTALAHTMFNLLTGTGAFVLLKPFALLVRELGDVIVEGDGAMVLALFHTLFNVFGVAMLLPLTPGFTRVITRLVRDRREELTRLLNPQAASMGALAVEAVRLTVFQIAAKTFAALNVLLEKRIEPPAVRESLRAAAAAVETTHRYLEGISAPGFASEQERLRHISTLHALNHLESLVEAARQHELSLADAVGVDEIVGVVLDATHHVKAWLDDSRMDAPVETVHGSSLRVAEIRKSRRAELFEETAAGGMTPDEAAHRLDTINWLDRLTYHSWRICQHLAGERAQQVPPSLPHPRAPSDNAALDGTGGDGKRPGQIEPPGA